MKEAIKRYVAYGRFSTDKQNDKSAIDQIALCDEHATALGWQKIGAYADEGITADSMRNRVQLQMLLSDAASGGFDVLMVESVDRFSRRPSDGHFIYEMLQFHNVAIFSLMDNDYVTDMHMALRMYESSQQIKKTKYNVKRGQAAAVGRGVFVGKPPYGYSVVRSGDVPRGVRAKNDGEAKIVQRIFAEYAANMSPVEIIKRLNEEGVPSPDGKLWRQSALFGHKERAGGILTNTHYRGVYRWGITQSHRNPGTGLMESRKNDPSQVKEVLLPEELRIIDDVLWDTVQKKIAARRRLPLPRRKLPRHVLSGLIVCSECGHTYTVSCSKRLGCSGRIEMGCCNNRRRVDRAELEGLIFGLLEQALLSPALVDSYIKTYRSEHKRLFAQADADAAALRKRIEKSRQELDRLVGAIANAETDDSARSVLMGAIRGRQGELEKLQLELSACKIREVPEYNAHEIIAHFKGQLANLRDQLSAGEVESSRAREAVRSLIDRVVIRPVGEEDGRGSGPVAVEVEGRIEAFLEATGDSTSYVAQSGLCTETRLSHVKWRASGVIANPNKTKETLPPTNSDLVLDFLRTANAPVSVDDLVRQLIESCGLDCSKRKIHMAQQRVQRSLKHLRKTQIAISVPVPGWRKYLWALKDREEEFWPDASHMVSGNYSDSKKVIDILNRAIRPISMTEIINQMAITTGERPNNKRARHLGSRIRGCLHFHRKQGEVLQVVYAGTQKQLWLLASRKDEFLPNAVVQLDGRIVNNANVLAILATAANPLTAPEIARAIVISKGDLPTERNVKLATDRVREHLRRFRSEGLVHEVPIPNSRFNGWLPNAGSENAFLVEEIDSISVDRPTCSLTTGG